MGRGAMSSRRCRRRVRRRAQRAPPAGPLVAAGSSAGECSMQIRMRAGRGTIVVAVLAAVALAAIAATYWYTVEPAPAVKVRWRAGIGSEDRRAAERRYRLVAPIAAEGRSVTYNLLDTSAVNIDALISDPA